MKIHQSNFKKNCKVRWVNFGFIMTMLLIFQTSLFAQNPPGLNSEEDDEKVMEYCGSSQYNELLSKDPNYAKRVEQIEKDIKEKTINRSKGGKEGEGGEGGTFVTDDPIVIPVAFHIIHSENDVNPGDGTNLSDARIYAAVNHLNLAYANQVFSEISQNTNISFCLVSQTSDGNATSGITRFASNDYTSWDDAVEDNNTNQVKNIVAPIAQWNRNEVMNVYIVNSITFQGNNNVAGYANGPGGHGQWYDGILVEDEYLGSSIENDRVLIHEVGHYLSLRHTFGNGTNQGNDCANNDCLTDNDGVCDTPPDGFAGACSSSNSCNTDGDDQSTNNPFANMDVDDPLFNYMDYGNIQCEEVFTSGQTLKMRLALKSEPGEDPAPRESLCSSVLCCPNPTVNADYEFQHSGYEFQFDASNSTGNISTYNWNFGNGVLETSTTPGINYTFPEAGVYNVCLTVTPQDGEGCTSSYCEQIEVCNYDINTEFTIEQNELIVTVNSDSNDPGLYIWDFGDNSPLQGGQTTQHEYQESGLYFICLTIVSTEDPNCEFTTCNWVNINSCDSLCSGEFICNGDFSTYFPIHSIATSQTGLPSWNSNTIGSGSPDNVLDLNTQNILTTFFETIESMYLPLNGPITPGCAATISFDVGVEHAGQILRVAGFNGLPCSFMQFETDCGPNDFFEDNDCDDNGQICISGDISTTNSISIPTDFEAIEFGEPNYPYLVDVGVVTTATIPPGGLTNVTFNWTNTTTLDLNYILIYSLPNPDVSDGNQLTYIDNVSLISDCCVIPPPMCECPDGSTIIDAGEGSTFEDLGMPYNYSDATLCISGTLIIDDESVWENVTAIMAPGAEIVVEGWSSSGLGEFFISDDSEIYGCDTMWLGITVEEHGVLDIRDSEIRDAHFAVKPRHNSRVLLAGNTFDRNFVGVYTEPSSDLQFFKAVDEETWTGNTFSCTDDLLIPFEAFPNQLEVTRSFAGIWLQDAKTIVVFEDGEPNFFEGSLHGVVLDRTTTVKLRAVEIKDLITQSGNYNTGNVAILLDDCDDFRVTGSLIGLCVNGDNSCQETLAVGVRGTNVGGKIKSSTISASATGITLNDVTDRWIRIEAEPNTNFGNTITAPIGVIISDYNNGGDSEFPVVIRQNIIHAEFGIMVNNIDAELRILNNQIYTDWNIWNGNNATGISASNSSVEVDMEQNQLYYTNFPNETFGTGIELVNISNAKVLQNGVVGPENSNLESAISITTSTDNRVCCNLVTNSEFGIQFNGTCSNTELRNTLFGNHRIGLQLTGTSVNLGQQINHGNDWTGGVITDFNAVYTGNPGNPQDSRFRTDPVLVPGGILSINVVGGDPNDWFNFNGANGICIDDCTILEFPWEEFGGGENQSSFILDNSKTDLEKFVHQARSSNNNFIPETNPVIVIENQVLVYPNPAKDFLNFLFKEKIGRSGRLIIYDITGKQLISKGLNSEIQATKINTAQLQSGIYFYKIELDGVEIIASGKIVIGK